MKYSIFIRSLKFIFSGTSILIILLIIYNNTSFKKNIIISDSSFDNDDFKAITQVLHNPTFIGTDKKEQPFRVMADKATRFKSTPDIFNLEKPTGEIKSGKEKFFLSGDIGIYNKQIQQLNVKGNVMFKDEKNMIFKTSEMYFDFKEEILSGNKKVNGEKSNSHIISEGFKIFNNGEKIFFTGKTKLTLSND